MNKNGFTLVELLAVIVILAIILAIAIPSVTGVVNNAKKNAFEDNAKLVIKALDTKKASDQTFDPTTVNASNIDTLLQISNNNYQTLTVTIIGGKTTVSIVGKDKWDGLAASGNYNTVTVSDYEAPPTVVVTDVGTQARVDVTSSIGVDASSLKYIWINACTAFQFPQPLESDFTLTFTNHSQISISLGIWRLWVLSKDTHGNTAIVLSDYVDNEVCPS